MSGNSVFPLPCSSFLTLTQALSGLTENLREAETALRKRIGRQDEEALLRRLIAGDVTAVAELARDRSAGFEDFLSVCYMMRGEPWNEARIRRDMRERIRLYRRLAAGDAAVPRTAAELQDLWAEAVSDEAALYIESERPQFRLSGVPFGHSGFVFEPAPAPPDSVTAVPEDIPREADHLLAFIRDPAIPAEIRAGAAYYAHGRIHPFRDGNGRTARMLTCSMLAGNYSTMTLLAFLSALQTERRRMDEAIGFVTLNRSDAESAVRVYLEIFLEAIDGMQVLDVRSQMAGCRR